MKGTVSKAQSAQDEGKASREETGKNRVLLCPTNNMVFNI